MKKWIFLIHDLNPWGGQDKSVLEIIRNLPSDIKADLYSFSMEGIRWDRGQFFRVRPACKRPILLKSIIYYLFTYLNIRVFRKRSHPSEGIHVTGACAWLGDVVQVQFIHAAWFETQKEYFYNRSSSVSFLRGFYQRLVMAFDLFMERQVYSSQKTYITLSERCAQDLRRYFGLSRIHVIPHGVDSVYFQPLANDERGRQVRKEMRADWGLIEGSFVILFVGAYERKGLQVAIEALAILAEESSFALVLIAVGNGNHEFFSHYAQAQKRPVQVIFASHTRDILPYYQSADLFLLPTLYEPFGLVVLEAMACGLPVMVSRSAGAAELIQEGESGILIEDPTSAIEIAHLLKKWISESEKLKKMGEAARIVARRRSWHQVASEYAQVFSSLEPKA